MAPFKPHFANTMGLYLSHAEKKEGANKDVYDRPGKSPPPPPLHFPFAPPDYVVLKKFSLWKGGGKRRRREGAFGKLSQLSPPFLGVDPRRNPSVAPSEKKYD